MVPFSGAEKEMSPPAELMVAEPARVTARAKDTEAALVVMSPARLVAPAPSWAKPPSAVMSPVMVSRPTLLTVTAPSTSTLPAMLTRLVVRSRSPVRRARPDRVVVPVPEAWVTLAALTVEARVRSSALATDRLPSAVVLPTAPLKRTSADPALMARFLPPLTAPPKVMAPPARETLAVRLTASL